MSSRNIFGRGTAARPARLSSVGGSSSNNNNNNNRTPSPRNRRLGEHPTTPLKLARGLADPSEEIKTTDSLAPPPPPGLEVYSLEANRAIAVTTPPSKSAGHEWTLGGCREVEDFRLQQSLEELLSDQHLLHDSRLRGKLQESANFTVPLTWLCSRYRDKLGMHLCGPATISVMGLPHSDASHTSGRNLEECARMVCAAAQDSVIVEVDARRLTVRRKVPPKFPLQLAGGGGGGSGKEAKIASQLKSLLDFYFEPFTLQHNRYLLDLLSKRVGPPEEKGPWVPQTLLSFVCSLDDLRGLGRIASALSKTKATPALLFQASEDLRKLKHLSMSADGSIRLDTPLEVRSFAFTTPTPSDMAQETVRYLSAAREQRGHAPKDTVSVFSYALDSITIDGSSQNVIEAKVKRQLIMHHSDFVCLQGFDPENTGSALAATLAEEGYGFACARDENGQANAIFWERSRWEPLETRRIGAAVALSLRLINDGEGPATFRVVCCQPSLLDLESNSWDFHRLFANDEDGNELQIPLLVCSDMSRLGGAAGSVLLPDLTPLKSVALEDCSVLSDRCTVRHDTDHAKLFGLRQRSVCTDTTRRAVRSS